MTSSKRIHYLLAAGALLGSGITHAQSNIAFGGLLDIGAYSDLNNATQVGNIQRSHLQVTGAQDIGDGLTATFKLRSRFDLDTGNLEGASGVGTNSVSKPFFQGESTVGIKGGFGAVRLGRALDAIQNQDWAFDPWENSDRIASPAWDLWHWNYSADPRGGGSGRVANAVFYDSPKFANMALHVSYSPETTSTDLARTQSASLVFDNGAVVAMLGSGKNSAGATETSVGLRGNFQKFSVMALSNISKSISSTANATTFGAEYQLDTTTLKMGWGQIDVDGVLAERLFSIGASRKIHKNFTAYVDAASKQFPGADAKSTYGIGITYSF